MHDFDSKKIANDNNEIKNFFSIDNINFYNFESKKIIVIDDNYNFKSTKIIVIDDNHNFESARIIVIDDNHDFKLKKIIVIDDNHDFKLKKMIVIDDKFFLNEFTMQKIANSIDEMKKLRNQIKNFQTQCEIKNIIITNLQKTKQE